MTILGASVVSSAVSLWQVNDEGHALFVDGVEVFVVIGCVLGVVGIVGVVGGVGFLIAFL